MVHQLAWWACFQPKPQPEAISKIVGRNEPCPCGSGKEYKHCCGKKW
ncbi:MAG: SEC-C domain-containing protein [Anaerolineae bacterium]|nr:SEC-C domain-containing protein [Anaerolineae bacterium]